MKWVNKVSVFYRETKVGELSMTPDNRCCAFEYDKSWLASGLELIQRIIDNCQEILSAEFMHFRKV